MSGRTTVAAVLAWCILGGRAEASGPLSPSNLLKDGEGLVGVEGAWVNETIPVTGSFGTGAARAQYNLEAMTVGGLGGYGFTDRLDGYLRLGGVFSPSAFGKDKKASGLSGGVGLRYMLVGGRSAELGAFMDVGFLSAVSNKTDLTVGTVRAAGEMRLDNVATATLGVGPQWWWRVGTQKYLFPSLAVFLAPRLVGGGLFTQAGGEQGLPRELADVDVGMGQILGFGGGMGLDLQGAIVKAGVKWFGSVGGGLSVEVPF